MAHSSAPRPSEDDTLHVLLATEDDEDLAGIPLATSSTPRLGAGDDGKLDAAGKALIKASRKFRASDTEHPADLKHQRWGVIAPIGARGDELIDLVRPLIELRREQQGAPVVVHRVPCGQSFPAALNWAEDVYEATPESDRPRYLLLLGDLSDVSLELQLILAHRAFVGRLCCADAAGYRNYVSKVCQLAREEDSNRPRGVTLFCANDGTAATSLARERLFEPARTHIAERWPGMGLQPAEASEVHGDANSLLASARDARVLLTVTHGLGAPRNGWDEATQRTRQGALKLGADIITAKEVEDLEFVPGGAWFCLACFGAGCPSRSVFRPWLIELKNHGERGAEQLLSRLGSATEPFIAALPRALLGSPRGPVAIVSHLDLAWTYAFTRGDGRTGAMPRVMSVLESWAKGVRVGLASTSLRRAHSDETDWLMTERQCEADARADGMPYEVDLKLRNLRWIAANDLFTYVLLGDPATKIRST